MQPLKRQVHIDVLAFAPSVLFESITSSRAIFVFVTFLIVCLRPISYHFPQFPFLRELTTQDVEVVDQVFASLHESSPRGETAIGLDAEEELAAKPNDISKCKLIDEEIIDKEPT